MNQFKELEEFITIYAKEQEVKILKFKAFNTPRFINIEIVVEKINGNTTLEECKVINKFAAVWLKNNNLLNKTTLSVESVGIDRELYSLEDCQNYLNHLVKIELKNLTDGKRNFKGFLKEIKYDLITLEENKISYEIDWNNIKKIKIIPNWDEVMKKAKHETNAK